jgi:hypothetical protein
MTDEEREAIKQKYKELMREKKRIKKRGYDRKYRLTNLEARREYVRRYRKKNPNNGAEEYQRNKLTYQNYGLRKKFGITKQEYDAMLEAQGGRCAVTTCRTDKPGGRGNFNVDHDPATGAIRGLLCFRCNIVLHHDRGTKEFLLGLIEYLEKAR